MINGVSFKNFRGLTELNLELAPVTMLTGSNGAGKTSVLEGLYCLFSETRLDVSPITRYNKSVGIAINQGTNIPGGIMARQNYNYKLFWEECASYGESECSVKAQIANGLSFKWEYKKATLSELDKSITLNSNMQMDSSTEFALWKWQTLGKIINKKNHKGENVNETFRRAQILSQDGGLYLLPLSVNATSACRYIDFATIRLQPQKLSFQTAKQLTKALQIIDPQITDVRLKDIESGLSVVLNNKNEVSLGVIGNGAVTWASALMAILDIVDEIKQHAYLELPILILIDEIGACIHYSVMLEVWKFLSEFAKQNNNIQFVFTSHSDDCIKAYCEVFSESVEAKIIRLHKTVGTDEIIPTNYTKESFPNIISGDWEVRG